MVGDRDWFDDMLRACPVMAILRGYGTERTLELAQRAWDLGITLVEIPIQNDAAVETLAAVATAWRGGGAVIGAGTVLTPAQVIVARDAGAMFTVSPGFDPAVVEQSHAQEVRMYQMVQFFVVLLAVVLIRAIREPTTARIIGVMVVTVCMYLTHEESFGVLLMIPIALFGFLGLRWCRDWRWWVFGGLAAGCIAAQVALAELTHPPAFGVDLSGGPLVQWSPQPFYYLDNVYFPSSGPGSTLTIVSLLAVVGVVIGLRKRDRTLIYLAAFWIVPAVVISLFLPAKNIRDLYEVDKEILDAIDVVPVEYVGEVLDRALLESDAPRRRERQGTGFVLPISSADIVGPINAEPR